MEYPHEAAGLILSNDLVVSLRNHAEHPEDTFSITREDIVAAIPDGIDVSDAVLWHSHPSGGIGPSRIDMQQKTAFPYHLVLALVDGEIIPTWY